MKTLNVIEILVRKRDKIELSTEQIYWLIERYTADKVPDYQMAAWLMAVQLNGMTRRETVDLTLAMAHSGDMIDLSDVVPFAVDKHSTGGVGDKTSLVVLPIVATCGVPVAKMSGRSLGHTGGTIDKLESIRGFRAELTPEQFKNIARKNQLVIASQSGNLAPADKKLYALRDVTATVPSIPLIASSIMSKKLAGGAQAIVLDVKCGEGAFMRTIDEAHQLARTMVDIGVDAGRRVTAVITDMNQPLGITAGNALEVREAIETLRGEGPSDFVELCLTIAAHMLIASPHSPVQNFEEAKTIAQQAITDGTAFNKFREMVRLQGGDPNQIDDPTLLPQARLQDTIAAPKSGYIAKIDARQIGRAVVDLGGGREKKGDPIDHAVGIETLVKIGDKVEVGDLLFRVHANDEDRLAMATGWLEQHVFEISDHPVEPQPLIIDTIIGKPQSF
ncbi:MAG: thymidine phosphorylase [Phototrophicales bacterium]|nr:MAG: thymidine phosphorylase [Phototrophicales bacterium]